MESWFLIWPEKQMASFTGHVRISRWERDRERETERDKRERGGVGGGTNEVLPAPPTARAHSRTIQLRRHVVK